LRQADEMNNLPHICPNPNIPHLLNPKPNFRSTAQRAVNLRKFWNPHVKRQDLFGNRPINKSSISMMTASTQAQRLFCKDMGLRKFYQVWGRLIQSAALSENSLTIYVRILHFSKKNCQINIIAPKFLECTYVSYELKSVFHSVL